MLNLLESFALRLIDSMHVHLESVCESICVLIFYLSSATIHLCEPLWCWC